jgi:hypothetical protein
MPGPAPKAIELRQRRNKSTTRAVLAPEAPLEKPRLPAHPDGEVWHALAKRWWKEVWASPQHYEYMRADLGAIFRLVLFVDMYWKAESMTARLSIGGEIRLLEREFGLTPLSRRRLEWQAAASEEAKDKHERRRARQATPISGDPRGALE